MRLIKIFLFCLLVSGLYSQNIVKVEYFIDADPGYGNAINVPVNSGEEITVNFNADLSGLAFGFHQLYIRTMDDDGMWSLPYIKSFYLDKIPEDHEIEQIEYNIDQGNVYTIRITPSTDVTENILIDLTGLSPGFHALKLWARDIRGIRSLIFEKNFYIDGEYIESDIASIEYYFSTTDTIISGNVYDNFIPATDTDLQFDLDVADLQYGENYLLHIYGRDQNGLRGLEYTKEFMVGSGNTTPELFGLPEHIEFNTDSSYILDLYDHVHDYDTPDSLLTFKFDLSSDSIAWMMNTIDGHLTISAYPKYSGSDTLWITVIDDSAASDQAMILVTIHPSTGLESEKEDILPTNYSLAQNYPNPFNPATEIRFALPVQEQVILEIYNVRGQKVKTLLNKKMPPGFHEINFIPDNLPSGLYFYSIKAGAFGGIKKMVYLR